MIEIDVIQQEVLKNWINQRLLDLSVSVMSASSQSNSKQKVVELSKKASEEIFTKFTEANVPQ